MKYADHLQERIKNEPQQEAENKTLLRSVYHRACLIHQTDSTRLCKKWYQFEKDCDNPRLAARILDRLVKINPTFGDLKLLRGLLHRRGHTTAPEPATNIEATQLELFEITQKFLETTGGLINLSEEAIESDPVISKIPKPELLSILNSLLNNDVIMRDGDWKEASRVIWTSLDVINPGDLISNELPRLETFWGSVIDSQLDPETQHEQRIEERMTHHSQWHNLLQYVVAGEETGKNPLAVRKAFSLFLQRFPYQEDEWIQWIDYEMTRPTEDRKVHETMEKAIKAFPLSEKIWVKYLKYYTDDAAAGDESIRELCERALAAIGLHYKSGPVWAAYIDWEEKSGNVERVFRLYERLLAVPNQHHDQHWANFRKLVNKTDLPVIFSPKETLGSLQERLKLLHETTVKDINLRNNFELKIEKKGFNYLPPSSDELCDWKNYLAFEKKQGDGKRLDMLYERALVSCALNESVWAMYSRHLEDRILNDREQRLVAQVRLRDVYNKACTVHLPHSTTLWKKWMNFEASNDQIFIALKILERINTLDQRFDESSLLRSNLNRRLVFSAPDL